jgi:hypothetical protein
MSLEKNPKEKLRGGVTVPRHGRLYVPQTHTDMDGTYYGVRCKQCGCEVRWGNYYKDDKLGICYVKWDKELSKASEGCGFRSLDEHDKEVCYGLIEFFNKHKKRETGEVDEN